MSADLSRLICAPRSHGRPQATVIPGSRKLPCKLCGRRCWVAPTSMRRLRAGDYDDVVCSECALREAEADGAVLVEHLSPDQLAEALAFVDANRRRN